MIAMRATQTPTPPRQVQRGRIAARRRLRRAHRRGYVAFLRVGSLVAAFVLPVLLYVMLTANLTSLNYKLSRAEAQKTALLAQTLRQDDRIAKLESRERLAAIAARLGMRDAQTYAVVTLPQVRRPVETAGGIALLGAVNGWLRAATGDAHP